MHGPLREVTWSPDNGAPRIRRMDLRDAEFALTAMTREGWSASPGRFEALLKHDPGGCFVASSGEVRVGMVTTTRYVSTGWIGNLIVRPEYRGRGLGTRLMTLALSHLHKEGIRTVRLEADPPGVRIYRRLGFRDEFPSLRFRLPGRVEVPRSAAVPFARGDLTAAARFDWDRFGDDRSRLLALLVLRAAAAFKVESGARIKGYCMLLSTRRGLSLGPCAADDPAAAADLLAAAIRWSAGKPLALGLPAPNDEGRRLLESLGFRPAGASLRMIHGPHQAGGLPHDIFAIASGAAG